MRIGFIYRIFCLNNDIKECYIGSCWDIKKRMDNHKSNCANINGPGYNYSVYSFIRVNGGWINWNYEYYIVNVIDKTDLGMKEQERMDIEVNPILNGRRAYTDTVEYKQRNKQYYIDNKASLNEKYICDCGGKYTKQNKARHYKSPKHQSYIIQV